MSDDLARNEIISKVNGNFFVEAGAGSGKTTILVERMVAMVEQGFPVDRICTITFTKAAANEFYARFQKRLSERSRDEHNEHRHAGQLGEQSEETKDRCQKALLNIDSCFMGTIDSFCNMILSEHPLEAGIPANSTVVEEEDIV
ncbi:MAG: UvrD-helicase domain-containing protein, partial [Erysipelotrichaceae bacterium]|nr:UvrD-helicase domain-containing protein [Erysipelotrichaceae bacterium]